MLIEFTYKVWGMKIWEKRVKKLVSYKAQVSSQKNTKKNPT